MAKIIESEAAFRRWMKARERQYHKMFCVQDSWFHGVQAAHAEIRTKMGSISKNKTISFEEHEDRRHIVNRHAQQVLNWIRDNFYNDQKLTNVVKQYIDNVPIVDEHNRKIKHSKLFIQLVKEAHRKRLADFSRYYHDRHRSVFNMGILASDMFSTLHNDLRACFIQKASYRFDISTSAASFATLGNYKVDERSCFRHEAGENEHHKYNLGLVKNSFVILIRKPDSDIRDLSNILARYWGVVDFETQRVAICNGYTQKDFPIGNALSGIKQLVAPLIDCDEKTIVFDKATEIHNDTCIVYRNRHNPDWVLSQKENCGHFGFSHLSFIDYRNICRCRRCNRRYNNSALFNDSQLGSHEYCHACVKKLTTALAS